MEKKIRAGVDEMARARDRLAAVGFMASLISHPVRNRLAALRAALELLEAGLEDSLSAEHRAMLLREFDSFIDDFNLGVDMIRSDFGALANVSAREILEESVRSFKPLADRMGISIVTNYAHGGDEVRADRILLRQTMLNLLRNSAEASGGTSAPQIALRTANGAGRLTIEAADNGPGVPADLHDRLFMEPVTSRPGGTGLGLSICRDAMALMHGSIEYVTPKGLPGACFRLTLPRDGAPR